ncbi:hypothetical protein [Leucothrix arctica]|uniref:Uncharacterized protein n=1 Tax=Leucothrix arctica TaxID=1481894 RepID=A0A317C5Z5_9GAMM|nr:hypothetical protein [Leucothrix arctica]PWQ93737.1 hypothetical protein DKT75_19195 [Leucothrix arctica]
MPRNKLKKKRVKSGKKFTPVSSKELDDLRKITYIKNETERNKKSILFLNKLRIEKSRNKSQRRKYIFNHKDLREIALCSISRRKSHVILDYSAKEIDLMSSLEWAIDLINAYSNEINEYIYLRQEFEKKYLLGYTEEAKKIISNFKNKYGLSVWGTEAELLTHRNDTNNHIFNDYLDINPVGNEHSENYLSNIITKINPSITASRYTFLIESNMEEMKKIGLNEYKEVEFLNLYSPSMDIKNPQVILARLQTLPIFDYYTNCIRLIRHISKKHKKEAAFFLEGISKKINDENIDFICYKSGFKKPSRITKNNISFLDACKLYYQGKYEECSDILKKLVHEDPSNLIILELLSKCVSRVDIDYSLEGLVGEVLEYFKKFNSGKYDKLDLDVFRKIALSHSYNDWSFILTGSLKKYGEGKDDSDINYLYDYSENLSTFINPFSSDFGSCCYIDSKPVYDEIWLDFWKETGRESTGKRLITSEFKSISVDDDRLSKAIADTHYYNNSYPKSLDCYNSISNADKQIHDHALLRSIRCLCNMGDYEKLLGFSAEKLLSNDGRYRLPLEYIIDKCAKSIKVLDENSLINLAIVYHFHNQRNGEFLQKISLCCNQYFRKMKITSNYNFNDFPYNEKLSFFVEEILTEDVLDGLIRFFNGQDDVILFRIKLLRSLINYNISYSIKNKSIIKKLSEISKSYLGEMVRGEIGNGKVIIDKDKLKPIIISGISSDYKSLKEGLKGVHRLEESHIRDSHIRDRDSDEDDNYFYIVDEKLKRLGLMFLHIRDEYAVNKSYGLDNYLNLNIRHGGMVNHLWSPIKANNLSCEKNSDGEYEDNDFWKNHYSLRTKESLKEINTALVVFTKSMDSLITEAKSWIHVNTGEFLDENKIFNFGFDYEQLDLFLDCLNTSTSVEEFIEFSFKQLDEMLDKCLDEAKERISEDFKENTSKCFDKLMSNIRGNDTHLHRHISKTKIEFSASIDELTTWFDYKKTSKHPLSLDTIVKIVFDNISNYFPETTAKLNNKVHHNCLIRGDLIPNFFDIFSLLITNSFEHASLRNNLEINVIVNIENNIINFNISNTCNKSKISHLKIRAQEIQSIRLTEFEKYANQDKGSGVCKVKKILNKDIGQSSEVIVETVNDMFFVRFNCNTDIILGTNA